MAADEGLVTRVGLRWLFDSETSASDRLLPAGFFCALLGLIYYSAFFSLAFQIRRIDWAARNLPADEYFRHWPSVSGIGVLVCAKRCACPGTERTILCGWTTMMTLVARQSATSFIETAEST